VVAAALELQAWKGMVMSRGEDRVLVYSSDGGRVKPERRKIVPQTSSFSDGTVRLQRQVKGRSGGTVIVISGVPLAGAALKDLASALKKKCGCGGTLKDGLIEIQGDHRELLARELELLGYRVKLAGG